VIALADCVTELEQRGFLGWDNDRLEYFVKAGARRVLQSERTWPFARRDDVAVSPGEPVTGLGCVIEVRSNGLLVPHRKRNALIAMGYDPASTGDGARAWYVHGVAASIGGGTPDMTILTTPRNDSELRVDYFLSTPGIVDDWDCIPFDFEDAIKDAAQLCAAKDAKDWATVQGLREDLNAQIGALVEAFYDQQLAENEYVIAVLDD
jgi:hypothetical protein